MQTDEDNSYDDENTTEDDEQYDEIYGYKGVAGAIYTAEYGNTTINNTNFTQNMATNNGEAIISILCF